VVAPADVPPVGVFRAFQARTQAGQRLELAQIETWLERELPVEGVITGAIAATGPLTSMTTRGDLQVRPRGATAPARVRWNGVAGVNGDPVVRSMDIDVEGGRFTFG